MGYGEKNVLRPVDSSLGWIRGGYRPATGTMAIVCKGFDGDGGGDTCLRINRLFPDRYPC